MESYSYLFKGYENSLKDIKREVVNSNLEERIKRHYIGQIEEQEKEIKNIRVTSYLSLVDVKKLKINVTQLIGVINFELRKCSEPVTKSISKTSALKTALIDLMAGFGLLHHKD